jgi:hypothetical protein
MALAFGKLAVLFIKVATGMRKILSAEKASQACTA